MEIWKSIKEFEGLYEISSCGRVRRFNKDRRCKKYKILSPNILRGYKRIGLYKNGKGKYLQIHRLVAETFIPNPDNLPQVNHNDEDPSNNNVGNLEWCTSKYNVNYGTAIQRQVQKRSKKVIQYDLTGNYIKEFNSTQEAAKELNLSQGMIVNCCNGGYWRNKHTKFIKCNRVKNFIFKYK